MKTCPAADRFRALFLAVTTVAAGAGCATGAGAKGGGGSLTNDQIAERNVALSALASSLASCSAKGAASDSGLLAITAKADGAISVDGVQWQGSDEMKACVSLEAATAKLPAWGGSAMSGLWAIGTSDHPPPAALADVPAAVLNKLSTYMAQVGDVELGPMAACAQRNLPADAYALVVMRVVVFPDGKVVGATPMKIDGEGRDVPFLECVRGIALDWKFEPFAGPGFVTTDVAMRRGIDPKERM